MAKSKFALVIGSTGAIGSATAIRLAEDGWNLYLHCYRSCEKGKTLVQELSERYPSQHFSLHSFEMSSKSEMDVSFVFELDALVFAHGVTLYKEWMATTIEESDALLDTYLLAPQKLLQALYPKLKCSSIVFIGSIFGDKGASWEVAYSVAKAAQNGMVKSLAREWATLPVRVNAVQAGYIDSGIHGHLTEEDEEATISTIPLKRKGRPEEIAHAVSFLVGDESHFITGQQIAVDGGWNLIG
ncbi:3-ketoacyl-ACP synthase [Chryseomicrobium excrementi]|uniref:3-ketoacyl-ACP synthase n=1 Tax=Chryseomicrobium excrementi TaxID=2041346 RepID=A0A2M9F2Z9_9BACL|nr:SDR family oxidoreductase [Chryseomicrobium excrementi]PJK17846.1 3-ketoacyl-ACP synthase [Chryseomicrobium excrementi]